MGLRRPADLRRRGRAGRRPVHHHHRPSVRGLLRVRARPARPRPLDELLGLVRDRLAEAVERLGGAGRAGAVLRARVLDAPRAAGQGDGHGRNPALQGAFGRRRHQQALHHRPQLPAARPGATASSAESSCGCRRAPGPFGRGAGARGRRLLLRGVLRRARPAAVSHRDPAGAGRPATPAGRGCCTSSRPCSARSAPRCGAGSPTASAANGCCCAPSWGSPLSFLLAGWADSLATFTAALVLQGILGGTFAASNGYLGAALEGPALSRALTLMQGSARAALVVAPIVVGSLSRLAVAAPPVRPARRTAADGRPVAGGAARTGRGPPRNRSARRRGRPRRRADAGRSPLQGPVRPGVRLRLLHRHLLPLPDLPRRGAAPGHLTARCPACCSPCHTCAIWCRRWRCTPRSATGPGPGSPLGFACIALGLAGHGVADSLAALIAVRLLLGAGLTLGLVCLSVLAADCARGRAPGGLFGSLEFFSKAGAVAAGLAAAAGNARFGPAAPVLTGTAAAAVTVARHRDSSPFPPLHPAPAGAVDALADLTSPGSTARLAPPARSAAVLPTADEAVAHTLLNCLLREVSGPEHQTAVADGQPAAAAAAPRRPAAGRPAPHLAARRPPVHRPGERAAATAAGRRWTGGGWPSTRTTSCRCARACATRSSWSRSPPATARVAHRRSTGPRAASRTRRRGPALGLPRLRAVPAVRAPLPPDAQGPHRRPARLGRVRAGGRRRPSRCGTSPSAST